MSLTPGVAFFLGFVMFPVIVLSLVSPLLVAPSYRTAVLPSKSGFSGWSSAFDWPSKKRSWIFARWGRVARTGTPTESWSDDHYAHLCDTRLICKKQSDKDFVAGAYGFTYKGKYFFCGWSWNRKT